MSDGHVQPGFGDDKSKHDASRDAKHEKKADSAEKRDYANQFWHKIEGSIAKDKLGNLKENVKGQDGRPVIQNPEGQPHRKKRRRRRSKANRAGFVGEQVRQLPGKGDLPQGTQKPHEPKPQEKSRVEYQHKQVEQIKKPENPVERPVALAEPVEPAEPVKEPMSPFEEPENPVEWPAELKEPAEPVKEPMSPFEEPENPVIEPEPAKPEEPVKEPMSPFEEPEGPVAAPEPAEPKSPFETEFAKPESEVGESSLPPKPYEDNKKQEEGVVVSETEIVEDEQPINPFEMAPEPKPLDQKSLDEKPLGDIGKVKEADAQFYEEAKTAEEMGEAKEAQFPGVENAASDFSPPESKENDGAQEAEVIESEAETKVSEVVKENESDIEDFKEDFWTVLEQAGITKKKLFVIIGAVFAVIFALLFYFMGWYKIFSGGGGGDGGGESTVVEDDGGDSGDASDVSVVDGQNGGDPYDIVSAYIFGLEFNDAMEPITAEPISKVGESAGFEASFVFGEIADLKEERYVEYVELLAKMQNIYEVDVYEFLNLSVDRRAALDNYLADFNSLINQGSQALVDIEVDLQDLDAQYQSLTTQAEQYETDFFGFVEANFGRAAHDTLELFIETSQEAIAVKAGFNSENVLRNKFSNMLALLRPRYEDVVANSEALIKGVRVFDVPESDINAIVPLTEE